MPLTRDSRTGRFERTIKIWNPKRWNEGFLNKGRFYVYKPDSKYVLYQGYALRHYVVWKWFTGKEVPKGYVIHHKDGNKINDKFENLILLTKKKHDKIHGELRIKNIERVCIQCKKTFMIRAWRLKEKNTNRGTFCSQKCYYQAGGRWNKRKGNK